MIRCDDHPNGSTYDCERKQSCGKGRCVPFGKKLCSTLPGADFCNSGWKCCAGSESHNSQVSCNAFCPKGVNTLNGYQHVDYHYEGQYITSGI